MRDLFPYRMLFKIFPQKISLFPLLFRSPSGLSHSFLSQSRSSSVGLSSLLCRSPLLSISFSVRLSSLSVSLLSFANFLHLSVSLLSLSPSSPRFLSVCLLSLLSYLSVCSLSAFLCLSRLLLLFSCISFPSISLSFSLRLSVS